MILHCPLCHGKFSIEALVQDQAGRDLLALMAQHGAVGPQLLQYPTRGRWGRGGRCSRRALGSGHSAAHLRIPAKAASMKHCLTDDERAAGRDAARRALEALEKGGNP